MGIHTTMDHRRSDSSALLLCLSVCTSVALAAPVEWGEVPETVTLHDGGALADCGGQGRGDLYLLAKRDCTDFILEWELTRLAAAADPTQERAIVVWSLDRQQRGNRRSYFLNNWLSVVGRKTRMVLVVRGGRAQLYVDGTLQADGSTADYGKPPARGAVGFLHYFRYHFRYDNVQLWDLSAGQAPSLDAPGAEVLPTGAVRLTWDMDPAFGQMARVEVFRGGGDRPLATVRGSGYLDRDTRPGQTVAYRVRLRLSDSQVGALSAATEREIGRVKAPSLPPRRGRLVE